MSQKLIFQAKAGGELEVHVNDEIGFWGITSREIVDKIKASGAANITLRINSIGGELDPALEIYNYLKDSSHIVTTKVDGLAASAATIVMQAANKGRRYVAASAVGMTHEASVVAMGKKKNILDAVQSLDKANNSIKSVYMASGISADQADKLLFNGDTWLSAEEMIEAGLADKIYNAPKEATAVAYRIAASAETIPKEVKDKLKSTEMEAKKTAWEAVKNFFAGDPEEQPTTKDLKSQLDSIEAEHENQIKAVTDKAASDVAAIQAKVNEKETEISELKKSVAEHEAKVKDLEQKLAKAAAGIEKPAQGEERGPGKDSASAKELSESAKILKNIFNDVSPAAKSLANASKN